jgi:hypothetical protein
VVARVAVRTTKPKAFTLTHTIADEAEPDIARTIRTAFLEARRLLNLPELARFFADRWEAQILDHQRWRTILNPLYSRLVGILGATAGHAAERHASLLPVHKADRETLGSVGFSFQFTNQEAVRWAETHAANLVVGVSEETRAAIRLILVRLYQDPTMGPDRAAREIRAIIGLTRRQAIAVDNLRRMLEQRRELATIARDAASSLSPQRRAFWAEQQVKTAAVIDANVGRYADRLLRQRSETIARTESMTASNRGQQLLWEQARTVGLVDNSVQREWITTPDIRLCEICQPMQGVRVNLDQSFTLEDGQTLMTPPAHPQCRCTVILRFS